jgi:integrase/recombinase XerC
MKYKDEFLAYLREEKRYSKHTVIAYGNDIGQFHDFINRKLTNFVLSDIDHKLIREWIVVLMSLGLTPTSVKRKISTLKTYFKYLLRERVVDKNPVDLVILPKVGKKLPSFVPEDKMDSLMNGDFFPETFQGLRDKLIIEVFYQTGIRRSELINLKLIDIDFPRMQILVTGKGDKQRLLPIESGLRQMFEDYLCLRKDKINPNNGWVFVTNAGSKVYDKMIYRLVKKYLSYVTTMAKKSPHVLRHTFATHLLNNGAELLAIKELLGHVNLAATQIYTHTSFKQLIKVFKQAHPRAEN